MYYAVANIRTGAITHTSKALCRQNGFWPKESMAKALGPGTVWGMGATKEDSQVSAHEAARRMNSKFKNDYQPYFKQKPLHAAVVDSEGTLRKLACCRERGELDELAGKSWFVGYGQTKESALDEARQKARKSREVT